jgi:hypothetical protein
MAQISSKGGLTMTTEIQIDETTRIFYLAQAAHRHAEAAQKSLRTYARLTKAGLTGGTFNDAWKAIVAAKEDMDKTYQNWQDIRTIITGNPELQAPKEGS